MPQQQEGFDHSHSGPWGASSFAISDLWLPRSPLEFPLQLVGRTKEQGGVGGGAGFIGHTSLLLTSHWPEHSHMPGHTRAAEEDVIHRVLRTKGMWILMNDQAFNTRHKVVIETPTDIEEIYAQNIVT